MSFDQLAAGQTVELVHMSLPHPELHVEMIIVGHRVIVLQHFLNYFSVLGRQLNLVAKLVEESYTSGVVSMRRFLFRINFIRNIMIYSCVLVYIRARNPFQDLKYLSMNISSLSDWILISKLWKLP